MSPTRPAPPTPTVRAEGELRVLPVRGIPEVRPGDDLAAMVARRAGPLRPWDVAVVTHKVVSKAEGLVVDLRAVEPSAEARELAQRTGNDPRLVEVILGETSRVLRALPGVLVCETRHGLVCANAGVDRSNVGRGDAVTLLPRDPDASADRIRDRLLAHAGGGPLGVVISDTFGRPFREAGVNVAIGCSGLPAISDHRGSRDPGGEVLRASALASADEIASAAELVMGKLDRVPVAVVRGLRWEGSGQGAAELRRDPASDTFRR